ncbi:MAG: hypothetical protein GY803_00820 [Chloroflexi bacterium]|nr:hypothetical protein [Chloroflexota bacterium]
MEKRTKNLSGILLIVLGGLALLHTTLLPWLGWEYGLWRFWPLFVSAIGLAFIALPIIHLQNRGLKGLFIPGFPILVISMLLLWGSVFDSWGVWENFWPMVVLGLALGFFAASIFMRNIWLMIPAIIIGVNGLIFQFCAITGLWDLWAILWTFEPLSVGLALLVASGGRRPGLMRAGLILCAIAAVFFSMMSFFLSGWVSVAGAIVLILAGIGLMARGRNPLLLEEKAPKEELYEAA